MNAHTYGMLHLKKSANPLLVVKAFILNFRQIKSSRIIISSKFKQCLTLKCFLASLCEIPIITIDVFENYFSPI